MENSNQISFPQIGEWKYEDEDKKVKINLTVKYDRCCLEGYVGSKKIDDEFSSHNYMSGLWFLFHASKKGNYIVPIDDERLIFGERKGNLIGEYNWQYELKKVS